MSRASSLLVISATRCFSMLLVALSTCEAGDNRPPTFNRDIVPILQARCQECHRRDQVGPFPLDRFEQVRKRAADVVLEVEARRMPPWKPVSGFGPRLAHDRSLPASELATLRAWLDSGAAEGVAADRPSPRIFAEGWTLGVPDLVLEMAEDFEVPASGSDVYRCFVIPTNLPRDVYVSAAEYRPGNRRVVHHLMAFVASPGEAKKRDEADAGPGYASYSGAGVEILGDLGGWAPGNEATHLPEGVGRSLPKNADVIVQVHYHPSGKAERDRTRVGLYFSKKPVKQTLQWAGVTSMDIRLPAGRTNIEVAAHWVIPVDIEALAVAPHMHQLGRDMKITATLPGGKIIPILRVADWDPAWQGTYSFESPIKLPRGSVVNVLAHYDNSDHPRNPNQPPRLVRWGQGSHDEMCVGYLAVVKTGQDLTREGEKDDLFTILVDQRMRSLRRDQVIQDRAKKR